MIALAERVAIAGGVVIACALIGRAIIGSGERGPPPAGRFADEELAIMKRTVAQLVRAGSLTESRPQ